MFMAWKANVNLIPVENFLQTDSLSIHWTVSMRRVLRRSFILAFSARRLTYLSETSTLMISIWAVHWSVAHSNNPRDIFTVGLSQGQVLLYESQLIEKSLLSPWFVLIEVVEFCRVAQNMNWSNVIAVEVRVAFFWCPFVSEVWLIQVVQMIDTNDPALLYLDS